MACAAKIPTTPAISSASTALEKAGSHPKSLSSPKALLGEANKLADYHSETYNKSLLFRKARIIRKLQESSTALGESWLSVEDIASNLTASKTGKPETIEASSNIRFTPLQLIVIREQLQKWFMSSCEDGSFDPDEMNAALILLDQYLFSVGEMINQHLENIKNVFGLLTFLLSPTFRKSLKKDWHLQMQIIGGYLDAIEVMGTPDYERAFPTTIPKDILLNIQALLDSIPYDELSSECLSDFHSYQAKLCIYLAKGEEELFKQIKLAAEIGEPEAQFDLALLYCGIYLGSENYVDLEKGLDYFRRLKDLDESLSHDLRRPLQQEQLLLGINPDDRRLHGQLAHDIARILCKRALARYFGIECIKDTSKGNQLLDLVKQIKPHYFHLFKSIIAIIEEKPKNISLLSLLDNSAMKLWFKGKQSELNGQKELALKHYQDAAEQNPITSGLAPVRLACNLERWQSAFESLQRYHAALIANGQEDEALNLEEELNQLAAMPASSQRPVPGKHTTKRRRRNKKGKKNKSRTTKSSPSSSRPNTISKPASAGPSQVLEEGSSDSFDEEPQHAITPCPKAPLAAYRAVITTPPASEGSRNTFNRHLYEINRLVRFRHYTRANQQVETLHGPTDLHMAKTMQLNAWIAKCMASDALFVRKAVGNHTARQVAERTRLREMAEELSLRGLSQLLRLEGTELEEVTLTPGKVVSTRQLSPEITWITGSLCSTLGHIYSDTYREHPRLTHLKQLSKEFYDCANSTNPCRLKIKMGQRLTSEEKAAASY
ncbi:hypothetical protein M3P05_08995 [Sansalvadorimonas sp. 2012CJ34-2]|uniref:Uncharacterized protein n=1 Tax=Parendozoicomonas callyspongiae TaxID=2942213 RepID=A0ABT0PH41_9GAMM|nr:hypothetical protein [Sansalvadorimonas sp. 2012CJ34-2]MCL6270067.1 hypothetical protein [Sansalvadorimonas sp. 2012CJ34-2]